MANVRPLSAELQKIAIEQLNEVPERIPADLEALRTWIQQQPHLRARTDDQFLLAFLRGCKFSLEKAKSKLDKYYTMRTKYPELFRKGTAVDTPRFREIFRLGVFIFLPSPLNDNGPRLGVFRMGQYDPEKYKIDEIMAVGTAVQDLLLFEDDHALICGVVGIMDMQNVSGQHMIQMSPANMKKSNVYSEEAMPFRPKAMHFVNTPAGFEPFFNLIKPIMSKKLQSRLWVHGNKMELLYEQVPKKYLPIEYGGENGSIKDIVDYWEKKLDEYSDIMKDEINYGTDENLRVGKPIDFEQVFGVEGSFRKLDVD